jgi:hypothetical protein
MMVLLLAASQGPRSWKPKGVIVVHAIDVSRPALARWPCARTGVDMVDGDLRKQHSQGAVGRSTGNWLMPTAPMSPVRQNGDTPFTRELRCSRPLCKPSRPGEDPDALGDRHK